MNILFTDDDGNIVTPDENKACEVALAYLAKTIKPDEKFDNSRSVSMFASPKIGGKLQEHFMIMCLDSRLRLISDHIVHIGTTSVVSVSPKDIFRTAIKDNANCIIALHNHPSMNPTPSNEDISLTAKLILAGRMIDIPVMDHVIVTAKGTFCSFRDSLPEFWNIT